MIKTLKKRPKIVYFDEMDVKIIDIRFTPEEILTHQESETFKDKNISLLLNKLPKRQKEVICLKYYSGLNTNNIANIMEVNYQSAANTIHKAIKNLREEVSILNFVIS